MILLNKDQIRNLLPHREPMLLIDELYDIVDLTSATAVVNVKKNSFFVQGHFPDNPVMPGVLIVESFGQAAAALTAHGLDKATYENKLVFLMGVEKARFRNPVIPDCKLELKMQVGDSAVFRGRLVVVESVHEDGSYWVVDQNGEGYEAQPDEFEHVY